MSELLSLVDMVSEDEELVPEILPIDSKLSTVALVSSLKDLFSRAVAIVPTREVIPNTGFVRVQAFDGENSHIQVSATDGDRSVTLFDHSVKVHFAGSALLPGKKMLDILTLAPDEAVRIDVIGNSATIRSGRAVWRVQTPVGDNLPPFPDTDEISLYSLNVADTREGLILARRAVATSSSRLSLMQIQISKSHIISCDGSRAHKIKVSSIPSAINTTLPLGLLDTLIRELAKTTADTFEFGSNQNTVVAHFGQNLVTGQRMTLTYPNVQQLMIEPALFNTEKLTLDRKELHETVRRVRVNADPDSAALYLSVRKVKGLWTLTVRARDKVGNASQETLAVEFESDQTSKEIVVNHRFLLDFLDCLADDRVTFLLGPMTKSKQSPIFVKTDSFSGVLMPMAPTFNA